MQIKKHKEVSPHTCQDSYYKKKKKKPKEKTTNTGKNIGGETGTLVYCLWRWKMVQLIWKSDMENSMEIVQLIGKSDMGNSMEILPNIKNRSIIWPRYPISGYFPKDLKANSQRDISILMFTAALFTMAKMWKAPKCSLMNEWIKKVYYTHTMKYYSATKKKEILQHVTTWMNHEDHYVKWNKLVTERQILHDSIYMRHLKWTKFIASKNQMVVNKD